MAVDSALKVQGRVIYALMMREIHTLYGSSRLGYLWAVINIVWGVSIFWIIRYLAGATYQSGMHAFLFLIIGFVFFNLFNSVVSKCMPAVSGNKALLTYPQVTPVDIMLARMIIAWATELVAMVLLCMYGLLFGMTIFINDFGGLLFLIIITPLLGLGIGMMMASLSVLYPTLEKIVPMVLRIMFFASAVFYSSSSIPFYALKYLWYNPILQIIEYGRVCLSRSYTITLECNMFYITSLTLIFLCLGLLFERYVRGRVK